MLLKPVISSCFTLAVIPSSMSTNLAFPATSAITGLVNGSHLARISPDSTFESVGKLRTVPYGTLWLSTTCPLSSITLISEDWASDMKVPSFFLTVRVLYTTFPGRFVSILSSAEVPEAAPPMWKVLMVN